MGPKILAAIKYLENVDGQVAIGSLERSGGSSKGCSWYNSLSMISNFLPSVGTILGAVIDVALVTALLYWLLSSIYGTRGYHLARGLLIILASLAVLSWLGKLFLHCSLQHGFSTTSPP